MVDQEQTVESEVGAPAGQRRAYQSPQVVETGTFEHLVLACTQQPNVGSCFLPPGSTVTS